MTTKIYNYIDLNSNSKFLITKMYNFNYNIFNIVNRYKYIVSFQYHQVNYAT